MSAESRTTQHSPTGGSRPDGKSSGLGRVLIAVYGILALAALGRSGFQIATKFGDAPLAYLLSALAAAVYVVATIALVVPGPRWTRVAWVTIGFELAGVLIVGTLSIVDAPLFQTEDSTVWSYYGLGYVFIPLVLPIAGLLWLRSRARRAAGRAD